MTDRSATIMSTQRGSGKGWHAHVHVGTGSIEPRAADPCPRGRGHATRPGMAAGCVRGQTSSRGGLPPSTRRIGRPSGVSNWWSRGRSRACGRGRQARSAGVTGRSAGESPLASVLPRTRPGGDARAEQQDAVGPAVVVAAGVAVDLGRPAELAHHHDQRVVEQAPLAEVFDQRGDPLVERRGQGVLDRREVLRVRVPAELAHAAVVDRDERDARLDQPAGQQARLADAVRPYFSRTASGSSSIRNAACAALEVSRSIRLVGELVAAGRQRRRRDVVRELVERLDHRRGGGGAGRASAGRAASGSRTRKPAWFGSPRDRERVVGRASGSRSTRRSARRARPRNGGSVPALVLARPWRRRCRSWDRPVPGTGDSRSAGGGRPGRGRPRARSCSGSA